MKLTDFLVKGLTSKPFSSVELQVEKDSLFWLPVIAGVATKTEVEMATLEELQILNIVANKKMKLLKGGG